MSSTLVETVSIDYDDFNESFLTCGTCLCVFDGAENSPKLLPCSHTVCRSCLERIVAAQQNREAQTFRCPICRETIALPRGGVASFPPSFLVNQLMDLMARQRRDVVPKCSQHSNQELLFCETCDVVFCNECTGGSHNGRGASEHTVIPFSIAIKRMSEILLYKASLCMRNLNNAGDKVNQEIRRLEYTTETCLDAINTMFQDLLTMVEKRRQDVMQMVTQTREEKRQLLLEQLDIIEGEKQKVQNECHGLQQQVEVRNITKRISDLNEKLDMSTTLSEPRENAYMEFEYNHNTAVEDYVESLNTLGRIKISTTFPALCTAKIEQAVTHLHTKIWVNTVDYRGNPRTDGADPIVAEMRDDQGEIVKSQLIDCQNGTYEITFTPQAAGRHKLSVSIFDRPIRDSPFNIDVTDHNNAIMRVGTYGYDELNFIQPVNVLLDKEENIYVLDTGNSRIKKLDCHGNFIQHIGGHGLEERKCTGMAMTSQEHIIVVNWHTKYVTEINQDGEVVQKFTHPSFEEPISVAVNSKGEIIVADNGGKKVFIFDNQGQLLHQIGGKGTQRGQFKLIGCVIVGANDEILVSDHRIQAFSRGGKFLYEITSPGKSKGQFSGITVDSQGNILASKMERGLIEVYSPERKLRFVIDSFDDKMKRPNGLVATSDFQVIVADLGNNCIKKFRYK